MGIVVKDNGGTWEPIPVGVTRAVCCNIYDLGLQPGFQGKETHKIVVAWEIEERKREGEWAGKRFMVTKTYTASLNEKATLRHDLESWRGSSFTADELAGFDLENIYGKPCWLNLVEQTTKAGRKWTAVAAIMPPKKGEERLVVETPRDYVPQWIADLIARPIASESAETASFDDDNIPF